MISPKATNRPTRVSSILLKTEPKSNDWIPQPIGPDAGEDRERDHQHGDDHQRRQDRTPASTDSQATQPTSPQASISLSDQRATPSGPVPRRGLCSPDPRSNGSSVHASVCANASANPGRGPRRPASSSGWSTSRATPCRFPARSTPTTIRISWRCGCAATYAAAAAGIVGQLASSAAGRKVRSAARCAAEHRVRPLQLGQVRDQVPRAGELVLLDRGQRVRRPARCRPAQPELGRDHGLGRGDHVGEHQGEQPRRLVPAVSPDMAFQLQQGRDQRVGLAGMRRSSARAAPRRCRRTRSAPAPRAIASRSVATLTRVMSVFTPGEVGAVARRDQEDRRAGLLRAGDLLLDAADRPDLARRG